jgi:hypothetical protein
VIGTLIGLIFLLIIVGLIWWGAEQLIALLPLPPAFQRIVHVLMIIILVIVVLWVLLQLLGMAGISVPHWGGLKW